MSKESKVFTSIVVGNGKITIPIEIRQIHSINNGDIVTFQIISITKFKDKWSSVQNTKVKSCIVK